MAKGKFKFKLTIDEGVLSVTVNDHSLGTSAEEIKKRVTDGADDVAAAAAQGLSLLAEIGQKILTVVDDLVAETSGANDVPPPAPSPAAKKTAKAPATKRAPAKKTAAKSAPTPAKRTAAKKVAGS